MPFSTTVLNIAIPVIGTELNATPSSLSWVLTSYIIVTLVFAIPFGKLADNFGKRKLLIIGILVFSVLHFLAGLLPQTLPQLIFLRAGQGLGTSFMFATNLAILADTFPPSKRGNILGIANTFTFMGLSAGPVLGGFITHYLGWRMIFHVGGAISLMGFILALRLKDPESGKAREPKEKHSYFGSTMLFMASVFCFFYGFMILTQNVLSYILFAGGIALFVLFIRRESKVSTPILEVRLFRGNPNFLLANLASTFIAGASYVMIYMLTIYMQLARGYSTDFTGLVLIIQPVVQAVISPFAGRLSDKVSPFKVSAYGMAACVASLACFSFLSMSSPLPYIILCLVLAGIGIGTFSSPNNNAVLSCIQAQDYGIASSILNTMRNAGHITSMAIITIILNFRFGAIPIAEASKEGLVSCTTTNFLIFTFVCVVGIFFSLGKKQNDA